MEDNDEGEDVQENGGQEKGTFDRIKDISQSETRSVLAVLGGLGGLTVIGAMAIRGSSEAATALYTIVGQIFAFYFSYKAGESRRA